ncbi:MAG: cytochrome P450, partial [Candidatus Binatia bacterium]
MEYNPFLPEVQANPFPYYAYLREHAPVYQVPGVGFWAVSRYDDVLSIVKNPHLFSASILISALMGDLNPWPPEVPPMVALDPPDHTRLRKLVNRAFTPRRIASLEQHIREIAHSLLDAVPAQGTFDLVSTLSGPLPAITIAELLGVPPERYADFKRWTNDIARCTNGVAVPDEVRPELRRSVSEMKTYLQEAINAYRKRPGDNLLSDMVRAEENNQTLTAAEVLSMAILVITAGSETTTNLISNALLSLCAYPEQFALVRTNPALIPHLVEETLRYESPVQFFPRLTMQEVTIAGTTIPAGSPVLAMFASANRDARKFPDPERFDITRNSEGQLAFSFGIHFCLGAQLARLEGKIALEALLGRFPRLSRTDEPLVRFESI